MSPPRGRMSSVAAPAATTTATAATGRLNPTLRMATETDTRRIALISDIHGNLPAFRAVLGEIEEDGVDATWCLGDLVGYGAQPNECVELAARSVDRCLVGNHDLVVIDQLDIGAFSANAAVAAEWTRKELSADARAYLEKRERLHESAGPVRVALGRTGQQQVAAFPCGPLDGGGDGCVEGSGEVLHHQPDAHRARSAAEVAGAVVAAETQLGDGPLDPVHCLRTDAALAVDHPAHRLLGGAGPACDVDHRGQPARCAALFRRAVGRR